MISKTFTVAWWEYSEKIASKAFLVSLILIPAVMIGLVVVPALFIAGSDDTVREIGLLDETGSYAGSFISQLDDRAGGQDGGANIRVTDLLPAAGGDAAFARYLGDSLVLRDQLEGYYIVSDAGGGIVDIEYRTGNVGNIRVQEKMNAAMKDAVRAVRLRESGIDPAAIEAISRSVRVRTMKIEGEAMIREAPFEQMFFSVYVYMMMLFLLILTSGQLLVRSMLEEKSSRIVELLLSSVSPRELMAGKIIGLSALGLTQVFCWGLFVFLLGQGAGMRLLSPLGAALLLVYFILGYLFYSAIFVTAGAPASTEQEAQQITSLLSIGLVIPLAMSFHIMQDPGSTLAVVLSMIPVFTPMMMAIRIPLGVPPAGEAVASLLILGVSAIVMMNVAGRIFSASMLLKGKRPTMGEIVATLRKP